VDITYRIPSKKVPYGYIEFTDSTEMAGLPDPVALAEWYAQFIKEYQAAEVAAFEAAPRKAKPAVVVPDSADDSAIDEAAKMLSDGLGGATEIDENTPAKPWDKTSDETESTNEKPWDLDDSAWDM